MISDAIDSHPPSPPPPPQPSPDSTRLTGAVVAQVLVPLRALRRRLAALDTQPSAECTDRQMGKHLVKEKDGRVSRRLPIPHPPLPSTKALCVACLPACVSIRMRLPSHPPPGCAGRRRP